jgi:hypothetical protein
VETARRDWTIIDMTGELKCKHCSAVTVAQR